MPSLASSLHSLSRCSARDSSFFTILKLTLLFSIEHLVDGLDLHLLVHGVLHPISIALFALQFHELNS